MLKALGIPIKWFFQEDMLLCVVGNGLSELEPFMEHPSHSKANLEIETMIPNP